MKGSNKGIFTDFSQFIAEINIGYILLKREILMDSDLRSDKSRMIQPIATRR